MRYTEFFDPSLSLQTHEWLLRTNKETDLPGSRCKQGTPGRVWKSCDNWRWSEPAACRTRSWIDRCINLRRRTSMRIMQSCSRNHTGRSRVQVWSWPWSVVPTVSRLDSIISVCSTQFWSRQADASVPSTAKTFYIPHYCAETQILVVEADA